MKWFVRRLFPAEQQAPQAPQQEQSQTPRTASRKRKTAIPARLREAVWTTHMGRIFEGKCKVSWCDNNITVFDFQCGHDVPESRGGETTIQNLFPICARCNLSMGDRYTFQEWCALTPPKAEQVRRCWRPFSST